MVWTPGMQVGNETGKIRHLIVPYTRGVGLDIGCGPWKAWPHFIGIDVRKSWENMTWDVSMLRDGRDLSIFADRSLDFVYSSHLLEHLEEPEKVLKEWWRVIKVGGHLVL